MPNKIYPCLWFDNQAKEAAAFYATVFSDARVAQENPFVSVLQLPGQQILCLNGCPDAKPNPAFSIFVEYADAEELQQNWTKLSAEGSVLMPLDAYPWSAQYGWVQDRFGISWQLLLAGETPRQKFTPMLMFCGAQQGKAAEALAYYTSLFPHSAIDSVMHYGPEHAAVAGQTAHARFHLFHYQLMALDSGVPHAFSFNESASLVLECSSQAEIDDYWHHLSEGGLEGRCGWVRDRFGFWWQVVPEVLGKLMSDPERAPRVSQAFMQMKKFDIAALENA